MVVRTFVALELSDVLKEGILATIESLRASGVRASWCRRASMHLTLKFLGDVDEELVSDVVEAVRAGASGVPGFTIESDGRLGAFPSPARARVLWLGIEPVDALFDLHAGIDRELARAGFPPDERRYRPHVTLGRLRAAPPAGLAELLRRLEAPRGAVRVDEVLVMKSMLRPDGAVHETLAAVPLGPGDDSPGTKRPS
jgi:2'-5' RNA ligase